MVCTLHCALCSVLCCALLWYAVWESNTALCPVHCTFHCIMHRALCSVLGVALVWYTVSESNTVLSLSTLKPITLLVWSANLEQANKQYRFLYPPPLHDRWAVSKSGCITQCIETLCGGIYCSHMVSIWNEFRLNKLEYLFNFEISLQVGL